MTDDYQEMPGFYSERLESEIIGTFSTFWDANKHRLYEVAADDFFFTENKALFTVLQNIYAKTPDIEVGVMFTLIPKQQFELFTCYSNRVFWDRQLTPQIMRLKEMASNRRVRDAVQSLITDNAVINPDDLIKIADTERTQAVNNTYKAKAQETLGAWVSDIGKPKERITTGFANIDKCLNGLRIPSVSIIGAYPSVGKTAFALNIITSLCLFGEHGVPTPSIFFSLEMSVGAIYERLISQITQISYTDIIAQNLSPDELMEYRKYAEVLQKMPLYVFDDVYHIENQSAAIAQIKPKFVVVDYVQKVRTHGRNESRRTEIDYISGMYKQISAANDCHIMLLSQLARSGKESPTMGSLKESGSLEADGDYVMLLNRPYVLDKKGCYANGEPIAPEDAQILIDKNKYGRTGVQQLHFAGKYQRFTECETTVRVIKNNRKRAEPETDECPF